MSDLDELYQEMILDHQRHPRNFRALDGVKHQAKGDNPLCGDRFTVYLSLADDAIEEIGFQGAGCAISTASASLMTEAVKGKSREEIQTLFETFRRVVTGQSPSAADRTHLGKLVVLAGVAEFPVRVKCATLAWHTLQAALAGGDETVSTE